MPMTKEQAKEQLKKVWSLPKNSVNLGTHHMCPGCGEPLSSAR